MSPMALSLSRLKSLLAESLGRVSILTKMLLLRMGTLARRFEMSIQLTLRYLGQLQFLVSLEEFGLESEVVAIFLVVERQLV